jgi:phosphomannomutase
VTLIKSISGIRGTIGGKPGDALTPLDVVKFSAGYGTWIKASHEQPTVVIGRDARLSGDMVAKLVAASLQGVGVNVVDIGMATTPTVAMAVEMESAQGGIIITASHNPIQWNALKLLNAKGEFISAEEGLKVLDFAESPELEFAEVKNLGSYTFKTGLLEKHIEKILALPLVNAEAIKAKKFRVAFDAVNSIGGIAVPQLLKALGVVDITAFNAEPDGHFSHNPEPLPENITQICNEIESGHYDLGIVVDPDVDRLVFVMEDGQPFGEEYTLVAVADYVMTHTPGNTVSNLSSTRALRDVTEKHGQIYKAAAVGEVKVVEVMKEINAIIGGEGNGGIIYPELHYGRDALVGIALFLSHLAESGKSAARLRGSYPSYFISKNKIELTPEIDVDGILIKIKSKYKNNPITDIDGVRIDFDKEWVHLRKSNTEPIIRIFAESEARVTADHLANKIILDIKEIISEKED